MPGPSSTSWTPGPTGRCWTWAAGRAPWPSRWPAGWIDHVGHLHHAVEQAEAGVRHVVDGAMRRKAQPMMHAAGRSRLHEVAADRAVNQTADLPPVDARDAQGLFARLDAFCARPNVGRPEPALANARHKLQPSLGQPQACVERFEPLLDVGRGDDLFGQRVSDQI